MRPVCTSMPARRRTRPNAIRLSTNGGTSHRPIEKIAGAALAQRVEILLGLDDDAERLVEDGGIELALLECDERRQPVGCFRDAGLLVQVARPQLLHNGG